MKLLTVIDSYEEKRKEYRRKYEELASTLKLNKGEECNNCRRITNTQEIHHIIPIREGGTNNLANMKRYCRDCHENIHGILNSQQIRENTLYTYEKHETRPNHPECNNCRGTDNLKGVYVIPANIGGRMIKSNTATLCRQCRQTLYNITDENGRISHSALINKGIQDARKRGVKLGRPTLKSKAIIALLYLNANPDASEDEVIKQAGISKSTLYRYSKRLSNKYNLTVEGENVEVITKQTGNLYRKIDLKLIYTYIHNQPTQESTG